MGRCWGCCQENCGYTHCQCACHPYVAPVKAEPKEPNLREAVKAKLGKGVMTATELARALGKKPDTVSSLLRKMVDVDEILRVEGFGSRGGYGYLLKRDGK